MFGMFIGLLIGLMRNTRWTGLEKYLTNLKSIDNMKIGN